MVSCSPETRTDGRGGQGCVKQMQQHDFEPHLIRAHIPYQRETTLRQF